MIKSRETHDPLSGEEDGAPLPVDSVNLGSGIEDVPGKERERSDLLKILGGSKLQYLSGGGEDVVSVGFTRPLCEESKNRCRDPSLPVSFGVLE